jgi:hypothetical protein
MKVRSAVLPGYVMRESTTLFVTTSAALNTTPRLWMRMDTSADVFALETISHDTRKWVECTIDSDFRRVKSLLLDAREPGKKKLNFCRLWEPALCSKSWKFCCEKTAEIFFGLFLYYYPTRIINSYISSFICARRLINNMK